MHGIALVHDVLDMQLVDRRDEKCGRVDALVLALEEGRPPRVAAILVGGPERQHRVGRWAVAASRVLRRLAGAGEGRVSRIPFHLVRRIAGTITVDVDGEALEADHLEDWIKQHVICRIPGATGERK